MKSYRDFVRESYSARENLYEVGPLAAFAAMPLMAKLGLGAKLGFGAWAAKDTYDAIKRGDAAGAALNAAQIANPFSKLAIGASIADMVRPRGDDKKNDTAPAAPAAPKSSSVVLARKGGVQGKLDKATGKWTKGDWTKEESDRYKRVAAQKAAAAQKAGAATAQKAVANAVPKPAAAVPKPAPVAPKPVVKKSVPVGDTIKTKVNPDSSLQVTQKRSKAATDNIKKALDIS